MTTDSTDTTSSTIAPITDLEEKVLRHVSARNDSNLRATKSSVYDIGGRHVDIDNATRALLRDGLLADAAVNPGPGKASDLILTEMGRQMIDRPRTMVRIPVASTRKPVWQHTGAQHRFPEPPFGETFAAILGNQHTPRWPILTCPCGSEYTHLFGVTVNGMFNQLATIPEAVNADPDTLNNPEAAPIAEADDEDRPWAALHFYCEGCTRRTTVSFSNHEGVTRVMPTSEEQQCPVILR